jgi:hypothetical protein
MSAKQVMTALIRGYGTFRTDRIIKASQKLMK